jgi:hypothetical protein
VSRPQWSTRSAAERLNAAHRRWSTPPEQETKSTTEIGVLQFGWNGERLTMNNDPTFNERVKAAQALDEHTAALKPSNNLAATAAVNDFTKHPKRWLTTPAHGIVQAREIRFEEIKIGRTLTEPERDAFLHKLAASK